MTSFLRRLFLPPVVLLALTATLTSLPREAAALTQSYCSFPMALTTFTYNGNAFEEGNSLIRLTNNAVVGEASSAFLTTPIPVTSTTAFHFYFRFYMGPSATGGDGVAFVLQNSAATALGGSSTGMGYSGIPQSVEIVFGTYKNTAGNAAANNVSMVLNGSATANVATATPAFTMAGSSSLSAWVDYNPTGTLFSIYVAQTATKPSAPVLTHSVNLLTQLGAGAQMFVGFTSATGAAKPEYNEHDIYELEYSTAGFPCACEGDLACFGTTPACAASNICATCSATNSSACTGATPTCNVPTNTCVGCLTNANCSGVKPICNVATTTCRACAKNSECSPATPVCDLTAGSANLGACVVCAANADCPPGAPRCNTASNTCVQCLSGTDCGGHTPVCSGGLCKPCATDADCGGATPACEVTGDCGQCSSTNASACKGATTVCDFPTGTCVGCEFNSDCSGSKPTCNTSTHTCRACANNDDCVGNPGGPACVQSGMKAGSCVVCQLDSDCQSQAAPKCDTVANLCVACLTSADCSGATPVCNTASNLCVACLSDTDCANPTPVCNTTTSTCSGCQNDFATLNPGPLSCPTATLPACQPVGSPLAGQCALCSTLNNSQCAAQAMTPVCIAATATCGCVTDSNCLADSYCDTTSVSTGVCTSGCHEVCVDGGAGSVDNCATGEYCSQTDCTMPIIGTCMSEPCNSNADCHAPTAVCNTIAQPHGCVQCLNDPDCTGGQVCDPSDHCVECTAQQTKNCTMAGAGAACLPASETCGCLTDADCGDATSGRICDMTLMTCVTGCRGTGGNGCPSGQTCSSTTGTAGTCQSASSSSSSSASSSSSSGGMGGAGGGSGSGGARANVIAQATGCSCRIEGEGDSRRGGLAGLAGMLLGLGLTSLRHGRRRQRRPRDGGPR